MNVESFAGYNCVRLADLVALDPPTAGTAAPENPLRTADIIGAIFKSDAGAPPTIVYGIEVLRDIHDSRKSEQCTVAHVLLESHESDELEQLAAMVAALRGHHDLTEVSVH